MTPDGGLELRVGVHSHGQGLETTLAQVAHEILGIDTSKIKVDPWRHRADAVLDRHLGLALHGDGGRRGGHAPAARSQARARQIGASLLQVKIRRRRIRRRQSRRRPPAMSASQEIARTWYLRPQDLPADVDPRRPRSDRRLQAGARHRHLQLRRACRDRGASIPRLGDVEILDYVIVEDGGKLVNPMVVDGQIYGGLAQGIGTALYEEMPFDSNGQPLASTFADYLLPGPTEVPEPRLDHMETPSPYTEFGVKGIGEGGAIAPPAAIANAVNDALRATRRRAVVLAGHAAPGPRGDRCRRELRARAATPVGAQP